jgi:hypothetical protein
VCCDRHNQRSEKLYGQPVRVADGATMYPPDQPDQKARRYPQQANSPVSMTGSVAIDAIITL